MFVSVSSKFFFLIAQAIEAATFFGSFFFLDPRPRFRVWDLDRHVIQDWEWTSLCRFSHNFRGM